MIRGTEGGVAMQIQILCVGKLKERYWREAVAEYEKRLTRYARVTIQEVPDESTPENLSPLQCQQVMDAEGRRLLDRMRPDTYVVALDGRGKQLDSEAFAQSLQERMMDGRTLCLVIGGSLGLSQQVRDRADRMLSLGAMTFPHQMVRIMLLEQIYRGFRILRGEPYHK